MNDAACRRTEAGYAMVHTLNKEQVVPARLERIFTFFENPHNLALITPPSLAFRVVSPHPVTMQAGLEIDYSLRLGGLQLHWRSLISSYDPPHCFVDQQLIGPYASWRHTHRFARCEGGTLLQDEVVYSLPEYLPGFVEKLAHGCYVEPFLKRVFDYRARFYQSFFNGGSCHNERHRPQPDKERLS